MKMWKMYAILIITMIIWGLNLPLLKYLVTQVEPVTMTAFRIFLAAFVVFVILLSMKLIRLPNRTEWKFIIGGALLNVVAHHYFLNLGLVRTTGTNAGLILGLGPVLTATFVALILRNYPSKLQWLGFFLGLIGISFVVLAGGEMAGLSLGDIFIFVAILVQVFSFLVISKAAKTLDPRLMTMYMLFIGSIILFVVSLIQEPGAIQAFTKVPTEFWYAFIASGVFGTAVGHMMYNYSVGKIGPSKAAIFINLNTLFSLVGSAYFLGEVITWRHLVGFAFIIVSVLLGSGAVEDLWNKKNKNR